MRAYELLVSGVCGKEVMVKKMLKALWRKVFGPSKEEVRQLNETVWKGFSLQVGKIPDSLVTDAKIGSLGKEAEREANE